MLHFKPSRRMVHSAQVRSWRSSWNDRFQINATPAVVCRPAATYRVSEASVHQSSRHLSHGYAVAVAMKYASKPPSDEGHPLSVNGRIGARLLAPVCY